MKWLALALLVGCEATIPTAAVATQAITDGDLDRGDLPVVAIVPRRVRCDDSATVVCTGTVISRDVVLTAASCVPPGSERGALEVFFGTPLGDHAGRFIAVADAVVHPMYDPATHAYDLALLRLAETAPVVPAPLPTVMLGASANGQTVRAVGYGTAQNNMIADGNKREGRLMVGTVAAATFTARAAPATTCGADAGGPLFVTLPPNGDQLMGLIANASCDLETTAARIDVAVTDFIQPYLAAPAAGPSTIALDGVCAADCATAADCPAAMACADGRCQVAGDAPGDYTTACTSSDQCGASTCDRVGPDDCRCHVSCALLEDHLGSCDAAGGGAGVLVGLAVLSAGATRRRRARGPRGRGASSRRSRAR